MGMQENLIITAIIEDTPGTLKAATSTDAVKFTKDTKPPKTAVKFIENPERSGTLSPSKGYIGPDDPNFDITLLLRGSGYQNVAPPCGKFLRACGFVENLGVGGLVLPATTASTSVFTVDGTTLTDEDDILVEIGVAFEPQHIDSLAAGTIAGTEVITLTGTTSIAPVDGAEIVKVLVNGTVAASPAPTTTAFDVTGGTLLANDVILVEVTGSTGKYYETTVLTAVNDTGHQSVTVLPALPAAPATGDDVVVKLVAEQVIVAAAPTTTVFGIEAATLAENDIVLVNVASGATPSYEVAKITDVVNGGGHVTVTVTPALGAAPTAGKACIGQYTYKPTSDRTLVKSLSVYHYNDGIKIAQPGCRGNVKMDFKWGEMAKMVFSMSPLTWTPTTAAAGFTPDFSALLSALPAMGGSFKVSGTEEYVESLSLDMGVKVASLGALQTTGYYENFVGARQPKGSFDPFAADAVHLTTFKAGASATVWLKFGSDNNIFVLTMPDIQRESVEFADREGINTYNVGYRAYGVSGNDEVILAFCSPTTSTP
jgi:hypothetical protein